MSEILVHSDGGSTQTLVVPQTSRVLITDAQRTVIQLLIPGLQGARGAGIELRGVFSTYAALIAARPVGDIGDVYVVVDSLYMWDADSSTWINIGPFRGPTGADGKPGQIRFTGAGAPGTIIGSSPLDTYLDTLTGDIWTLT